MKLSTARQAARLLTLAARFDQPSVEFIEVDFDNRTITHNGRKVTIGPNVHTLKFQVLMPRSGRGS